MPERIAQNGAGGLLVVGIGASAGGLEACEGLLRAVPAGSGMAFIVVQHLDPTHKSMMADLLTGHTPLSVRQAADGMRIEPDHCYLIPPATYLSVAQGELHLSEPLARHGARLPFDFLLHSLAEECGPHAACVILSGTGADGSLGLKSIKEKFGLVVAQLPEEAAFDGMPRSAIQTGAVDLVLPVAKIPAALINYRHRMALVRPMGSQDQREPVKPWLPAVVALLLDRTGHDFSLYKPGTLQRRIERRMAIAAVESDDMDRYLDLLRGSSGEIDLLAKDLFIHVTSFFRDAAVFDLLAEQIIPVLLAGRPQDHPLRVWIAGCSTGEETYSLAMLFREQLTTAGSSLKLQIFASDVDADAIAIAREGLYPVTIEADVSPARLDRFFTKQDQGYRVTRELRDTVIFTVQDVLADPPFSRLDLVSCRNLLIYLRPEAQAKVIALFHFALQPGGILLLGTTETVGSIDGRFEPIAKSSRIYRRTGTARSGEHGWLPGLGDGVRLPNRPGQNQTLSRHASLADLCRRLVIDAFAPAAVLVNRDNECLFSLGPTDRYLRVPPGHPTQDLLAMVREDTRIKLRSALQQAGQSRSRVVVTGARVHRAGATQSFNIEILPVPADGGDLMLVCFVDVPLLERTAGALDAANDKPATVELQNELNATRLELKEAVRNLELSSEEQRAINEEALSVNEEYQSANEELLTSKEELQSLNEELTALNSQLQETLERQRATANDLQNVLYSTDVATIFLDRKLCIRFFTPSTKSLFNVLPTDIGRPLADLNSLTTDGSVLLDSAAVLSDPTLIEREIKARDGTWYLRRVLPYRTQEAGVEGVVITFVDITERRRVADALDAAKREAELASLAKSRFLAAASHDLRQPLQTLVLLQGALASTVQGERPQRLLGRFDLTLEAMTGMLDALLDINRIEAGTLRVNLANFPVYELISRIAAEFAEFARAKRIALRVVPCSLRLRSDPILLEQIIRNLLGNAVKYTQHGKILLGCRRRGKLLSVQVWDTGIGIPATELQAIFEEYHQVDNSARERGRGFGLGLAIVQRLSLLLKHPIRVKSTPGKGSVFAIDIEMADDPRAARSEAALPATSDLPAVRTARTGAILVIDDDPEIRELLEQHLTQLGHRTTTAADAAAALDLVARHRVRPDLILADFNLPNAMTGLELATELRERLHRQIPTIILTGDISTDTLREIMLRNCVYLHKPVRLRELDEAVQRLLPAPSAPHSVRAAPELPARAVGDGGSGGVIFVVDDDAEVRGAIRSVLEADDRKVEEYASCEAFLDAYRPTSEACLLVDAYLPGMDGLTLLRRLQDDESPLPAIMITGNSDVAIAVEAMKAGATDFIEKPVSANDLLACVARALEQSRDASKLVAWREAAADQLATLTPRQRDIMQRVLAGDPSKNIAADLGISQRTVENHRAAIMRKTGSKSLPALARLAIASASAGPDERHRDRPAPAPA